MTKSDSRNWLIQFNPKKWDIYSFLQDGRKIESATITKNRNAIAKGARFILWLSGQDGGIIGYGHFTGEPVTTTQQDLDFWKTTPPAFGTPMGIQLEELFIENPIPRTILRQDSDFGSSAIIKIPFGGNALPVTDIEWLAFERIFRAHKEAGWAPYFSTRHLVSVRSNQEDTFGEIPGYPEGSVFESRDALRKAGLHSKQKDDISGVFEEPADAIVLSGAYKGDLDEGDYILYTGQGGRDPRTKKQIKNQVLKNGNLSLMMSKDRGIPIRIIRGSRLRSVHSPSNGYRYDGLYSIDDAFTEKSGDGPWIWRFELRRIQSEQFPPWGSAQVPISTITRTAEMVAPAGNLVPSRSQSGVIQRIVRNSRVTQFIKTLYDNQCQFCEIQLKTSSGGYSEGAHIRPLGGVHQGSDTTDNILCLCANCHTLFDKGALYIDEISLSVKSTIYPDYQKTLIILNEHKVNLDSFEYHRVHIAGMRP